MEKTRKIAIVVGFLFITATVTAILSGFILESILDGPDYLLQISENENQIIIPVILELILAVSVIGIGFLMYPILKKYAGSLAVGYVSFRVVEGLLIIIASISLLSLLTISQEYVGGNLDSSYYEPIGLLLKSLREWSFVIGTLIFLGLGGLVLNYLLYISRLIPRLLSVWGIIGAAFVSLYGVISLFDYDPYILAAPIAVQEMIFAVWIVIKGFSSSEIIKKTSKTEI